MLKQLHIRNLAIIEEVSLEFGAGFVVLTGETGAGKSILIDGLNLALGERADRDMVRAGSDETSVEAVFDLADLPRVREELGKLEVESMGEDLLLRRVVTAAGRSRCAINGSPVPLGLLKRLGDLLVDLHGQHEHQLLLNRATHLEFLDAFAGLLERRVETAEAHRRWRECRVKLDRLAAAGEGKAQRLDLLNYQIGEIDGARLKPGEEDELAVERIKLSHVQKLTEALHGAREALLGEGGANERVGTASSALKGVAEFDREGIDPSLEALGRLADAVQEEGTSIRDRLEKLEADPKRLETIEERLDVVNRLKRKYGESVEAVLEYVERARQEAAELSSSEESIAALKTQLEELRQDLSGKAGALSKLRREAAPKFSRQVVKQLKELAMEQAELDVTFGEREDPGGPVDLGGRRCACTAEGADAAEFLLAPNPGEGLRSLSAIASGGELSRIMLAIKSVLARVDQVGTLVFDEIDSGIGGRAAEVAGRKLAEIGRARQVLGITHLPQIAACAGEHVVVRKRTAKGHALVTVGATSGRERVEELARMLAGEEVTPSARKHAEEMLRAR